MSDERPLSQSIVEVAGTLSPADSIVQSAQILCDVISTRLAKADRVTVVMDGLRGASSSFFNVLIGGLVEALGEAAFHTRVEFRFDSDVQRDGFQRSLKAIVKPGTKNGSTSD